MTCQQHVGSEMNVKGEGVISPQEKSVAKMAVALEEAVTDILSELRIQVEIDDLSHSQLRLLHSCLVALEVLLRKNRDYGQSVWTPPVFCPSVPVEQALLVRMSDKVARVANLMSNSRPPEVEEAIQDTLQDLANYCHLLIVHLTPLQS